MADLSGGDLSCLATPLSRPNTRPLRANYARRGPSLSISSRRRAPFGGQPMSRADDAITGGLPRERERPGCPGPVRGLLFAHAAFAALTAVYFLSDPHQGTARSAAAVIFLVAGTT